MTTTDETTDAPDRVAPIELLVAGVALGVALVANYASGRWVDAKAAGFPPSFDLVHSAIPFVEMPIVHTFGFGAWLAFFLVASFTVERRRRFAAAVWAFSLLMLVRSGFLVLTPLGMPEGAPHFDEYPVQAVAGLLDFRQALFFSGHTATPFLGFLLARTPWVRAVCLGFCVLLASEVLLARLHYSIDVGAAFFIAFGVHRAARWSWRHVRRAVAGS